MQENNSFISFDNEIEGLIMDDSKHKDYPIRYYNMHMNMPFIPSEDCSYYIYVYEGCFVLNKKGHPSQMLADGMFASINGGFELNWSFNKSRCVIVEVLHTEGKYPENKYRAYNTIGGYIEEEGRLKYIDGCTDSLLIPPVKLGDPCLNHLHFPEGIDQTQHTHPSHRIGIVAKGNGECITPFGNLPLTQGMIFVIKEWDGETMAEGEDGELHPIGQHAFKTFDGPMDVIAFHPDSDFGPTDVEHPMINRTIVDGVSASELDDIRTK